MGVKIRSIENMPVHIFTSRNKNGVWSTQIVYKVELDSLKFKKSDECTEIKYFTRDELLEVEFYQNVKDFINTFDFKKL